MFASLPQKMVNLVNNAYTYFMYNVLSMVFCYNHTQFCTLELLKQRFGEATLHYCEVMLKDVADSRRLNAIVLPKVLPC